jgi:hypothetical protein
MSFPRFEFQEVEPPLATLATKPIKNPSSVATVAVVAETPREIDLSAFAERAAIMEYDGSLPRAEAEQAAARELGFDTTQTLYRASIEAWGSAIVAAPKTGNPDLDKLAAVSLRFLASDWATKALVADWDETALFAIHEGQSPKERIDAWGLVPLLAWGVHRCTIESFSRNSCELRTQRGATLRQPRMWANFDEAVPWWRHPGISNASMAR